MSLNKIAMLVIALCLSLFFAACEKESGITDYSKSEHWLSLPSSPEKNVDVFYLYPTSFQKSNENDPNICEIDNPSMLKKSKDRAVSEIVTPKRKGITLHG